MNNNQDNKLKFVKLVWGQTKPSVFQLSVSYKFYLFVDFPHDLDYGKENDNNDSGFDGNGRQERLIKTQCQVDNGEIVCGEE